MMAPHQGLDAYVPEVTFGLGHVELAMGSSFRRKIGSQNRFYTVIIISMRTGYDAGLGRG